MLSKSIDLYLNELLFIFGKIDVKNVFCPDARA